MGGDNLWLIRACPWARVSRVSPCGQWACPDLDCEADKAGPAPLGHQPQIGSSEVYFISSRMTVLWISRTPGIMTSFSRSRIW